MSSTAASIEAWPGLLHVNYLATIRRVEAGPPRSVQIGGTLDLVSSHSMLGYGTGTSSNFERLTLKLTCDLQESLGIGPNLVTSEHCPIGIPCMSTQCAMSIAMGRYNWH